MKILIIGGGSKLAGFLFPLLLEHSVCMTTRKTLDLSAGREFHGSFDVVIVCAFDFLSGRPEKEQRKRWKTNVDGIINALSLICCDKVIFISSYRSGDGTAYGNQKKAVEDWLIEREHNKYCRRIILRPHALRGEQDYVDLAKEIVSNV